MHNTMSPALSRLSAPAWVDDLVQSNPARFALNSTRIIAAEQLSDAQLHKQARTAYETILGSVSSLKQYPIRFWNNVPRLTYPASEQRNRYMVFNAGRYE